jgi:hypothetical protein
MRLFEEQLSALMDNLAGEKHRSAKKTKLQKRDTAIFAAILLGHQATSYCEFLHKQGVRPKWANGNSSNASYPASYQSGNPLRKKVQDEKTRAKTRMNRYTESELAKAFQAFLPRSEDELRQNHPEASIDKPPAHYQPSEAKLEAKLAIPVWRAP